ncbi:MAG: hypothetical protein ACO3OL_01575 [bacterium]
MKAMRIFITSTVFLLTGILYAQGLDQRCTQMGDSACVDWDRGVVMAEGLGAPASSAKNTAQKNATALRAAKLDAARNMLEMIKGINLSSSTTMRDAMVQNDTVRTQVQGRLFGLRPSGKPRYFSDGSVSILMEASLRQTIPDEALTSSNGEAPRENSRPSSGSSASDRLDPGRVNTGLIIDARGSGAQPAMSPKIYDEEGNELYGSAYVDQEFVQKHGMAGYVRDLDQALANDRVQGTPAVLKALSSSGANQTDLILSKSDADQLRGLADHLNFLREARVVIVLD